MADPVETDIDVVQGATFKMEVTWADKTTDPPTPLSLAGYYAHMQVRTRRGTRGTPLLNLASYGSSPSLSLEPSGRTGVIKVRMSALDTAKLRRDCYYDLFIVKTSDATQAVRLVFGKIDVNPSVTVQDIVDVTVPSTPDDSGDGVTETDPTKKGNVYFTNVNNASTDTVVVDPANGYMQVVAVTDGTRRIELAPLAVPDLSGLPPAAGPIDSPVFEFIVNFEITVDDDIRVYPAAGGQINGIFGETELVLNRATSPPIGPWVRFYALLGTWFYQNLTPPTGP